MVLGLSGFRVFGWCFRSFRCCFGSEVAIREPLGNSIEQNFVSLIVSKHLFRDHHHTDINVQCLKAMGLAKTLTGEVTVRVSRV